MSKVLLVEDYPVIQQMYGEVLKKEGFDIDVVADGKEALDKVKKNSYDVVLLDLLLPEVNGIEFLEQFKERGKTRVIALTDFDYKETVDKAYTLGIDAYWIKAENTPYVLASKLKELLSGKPKANKS